MCAIMFVEKCIWCLIIAIAPMKAAVSTKETAIILPDHELDQSYPRYLSIYGKSSTNSASLKLSLPDVQEILSWHSIEDNTHKDGSADSGELSEHDGLVMSVIHEVTGQILLTRTFQTWSAYAHAQDLVWWLERVQAGRLVVLMIKHGGTYGLEAAFPTLRKLGSLMVDHTPPKALWLWVFVKGGQTISETLHPIKLWWIKPPLRSPHSLNTHGIYLKQIRRESNVHKIVKDEHTSFCNNHAAMGTICDISKKQLPAIYSPQKKTEFGIVVSAGGRVQYLANAIEHLLQCPELTIDNLIIALSVDFKSGIPDSSAISLLELYGIRYKVVNSPSNTPSINHRLFQFYRGVWRLALNTFPQSKYLIFLDEDVSVTKNWMTTLLHATPALDIDPSLWCVSGTGAAHPVIIQDPTLLLRGDKQAGWGFLVRSADVHMAVESWPDSSNVSVLYDTYLHLEVGRGRDCIYPAMDRARHFGVGVNTIGYLHQRYFLDIPFYDGPPVQLTPINQLVKDSYEARVIKGIKSATTITRDPCANNFLQSPPPGSSLEQVFYFTHSSERTLAWTLLAECVGAWPYNTDGHHNWMWELPQSWGGSLWLVGVPASPYSKYMPRGNPIWPEAQNIDETLDKQEKFFKSVYPIPSVRSFDGIYANLFGLYNKTLV